MVSHSTQPKSASEARDFHGVEIVIHPTHRPHTHKFNKDGVCIICGKFRTKRR